MNELCHSGEADTGWPSGRLFCPAQKDTRGGENWIVKLTNEQSKQTTTKKDTRGCWIVKNKQL